MLLCAVVVGLLIRKLQEPATVAPRDPIKSQAVEPNSVKLVELRGEQRADPAQFQELLQLSGWNKARFARLNVDSQLSEKQILELLELLRRLQTFDVPQLAAWALAGTSTRDLFADPGQHLGELAQLRGRVTSYRSEELTSKLAERLEMSVYYVCQMQLDEDAGEATILTARIPAAWKSISSLNEPSAAVGVLVKATPEAKGSPNLLFLASEISWHPQQRNKPFVSLGKALLGDLGVDVGLFDGVRQRRPISSAERELFFQILDASGRIGANQLNRLAGNNLSTLAGDWKVEEHRLKQLIENTPGEANPIHRQRVQLAQEFQNRAYKGLYSVAPLFNLPEELVGELFLFEGTARRVTRVEVDELPNGTASDVVNRFGILHYYEIDIFTDDSQNNPIVFCVRELPADFPIGDGLHEHVQIAGFFFKSWSFRSHRADLSETDDAAGSFDLRQFAPLLIGRAPIWIAPLDSQASSNGSYLACILFLLLLVAVWTAGIWLARNDRQFRRATLAKNYSLPDGESLNDLNLDHSPSTRENE